MSLFNASKDAGFLYDLLQVLVTKNENLETISVKNKLSLNFVKFKSIIKDLEAQLKTEECASSINRKAIKVCFSGIPLFHTYISLFLLTQALYLDFSESKSVTLSNTTKNGEGDESGQEYDNYKPSDLLR